MTEYDPTLQTEHALKKIDLLFEEKGYFERLALMLKGLTKPKNSRAFKRAMIELQRQAAPLSAVIVPLICVIILAIFAGGQNEQTVIIQTEYIETQEVEVLDDIEPPDPQPQEQFEPMDFDFVTPEIAMDTPVPVAVSSDAPMSPQPTPFDAVMSTPSHLVMRGIFGDNRSAGMRGQLLARGGGNKATETAVLRALRWLKKNQNPDGSWGNNKTAMTGLAILTFLAHGEKPGSDSPEFGATVQKAIEYLMNAQNGAGNFGGGANGYPHAIACYAMCEAYGMTMNPNVREAAQRGVNIIIDGQHPSGGWDYNWVQSERDDTSVMGWAAQALKAALMAKLYDDPADVERLERAGKLSVKGFQKNSHPNGGFGYTGPQQGGLTGVGVLCMMFHGAGNYPEVSRALDLMDGWQPVWNGKTPLRPDLDAEAANKMQGIPGGSTQYYYYYATQAKFHAGGSRWKSWNDGMWPAYCKAQFVEEKAIEDVNGELQDIGWWVNCDGSKDGSITMDTCLAALQLMVYYRYLPTTQQAATRVDADIVATAEDASTDIEVDTGDL
ncbi:MAG: prenyltransferase/squalene oxidase repeat-containing protein [Kiritimatiellia bacterium]|jgi:hypothetical protein